MGKKRKGLKKFGRFLKSRRVECSKSINDLFNDKHVILVKG